MSDEDGWLDEPSMRLSKDLRDAAIYLGDHEARFLVDAYYSWQDERKRANSQVRMLGENEEPHGIITWLASHSNNLESQIKMALEVYVRNHKMYPFFKETVGIGPVIGAGLVSHIHIGTWCGVTHKDRKGVTFKCRARNEADCKRYQEDKKRKIPKHEFTPEISAPTIGKIWAFAGIAGSGQKPWERKQRRPWSAPLRTLCWKIGISFLHHNNNPNCYYGHVYKDRKAYEIEKNNNKDYAKQAAHKLATTNIDKNTDAYKAYSTGFLPPGHIDQRARRYATKLFLAHMWELWYELEFNKPPPKPYPIARIPGHTHYIPPPTKKGDN